MPNFSNFLREGRREMELKNYLDTLINGVLRRLQIDKSIKKAISGTLKESLRDKIEKYLSKQEYFDEETFVMELENIIREALSSCQIGSESLEVYLQQQQKQKVEIQTLQNEILNKITSIDNNGKRVLSDDWRDTLYDYFRKSPEKKGINFRDKVEDKDELRAWLYLCLTDESEKQKFRQDFERALNQGEPIFYRLWPPSIANVFRALIGLEQKQKGFNKGEFMKSVEAYLEDINQGKDRITLWFKKDLLPDELKDKSQEELEQLGIIRNADGQFEIYFNSDQYWKILDIVRKTYTEGLRDEIKIEKLLKEVNDLFNELRGKAPPEFQHRINAYGSKLTFYAMGYQRAKSEEGLSDKQLDHLIEELNNFKVELKELEKDIEEYKSETDPNKKKAKFKEIMTKSGKFLFNAGKNLFSFTFSSLAAWGIALGWFLPLYLINVMYNQIEKGPFGKK